MSDKIEREIAIAAPVERVWGLVTEPGWWVNEGDGVAAKRHREGDLEVVEHSKYGRFPVRTETVDPQRYVSYRWASVFPGENPAEGNSTLIEFWLTERDGGTLLRVVESGFASLAVSEEVRAGSVNDNTGGWKQQFDVVKSRAEQLTV